MKTSVLIFLLLIASQTAFAADVDTDPPLKLVVKINGKTATSVRQMAVKLGITKASPELDSVVDSEIEKNFISLKFKSVNQIQIFVVGSGGTLRNVTLDPHTRVESTLQQLQFNRGHLIAIPEREALDRPASLVLEVFYYQDDAKTIFGSDMFPIRVTD